MVGHARDRILLLVSFLAVPLCLLVVFSLYPAAYLFWLSFMEWDGISTPVFAGLDNYIRVLTDPRLLDVLGNNLYYFVGGLAQIALALYLAIILTGRLRGTNLFKTIIFSPYVMNSVAIVLIFRTFFMPSGTFDSLLDLVGLSNLKMSWLGNPATVNPALVFTSVWRYLGLNLVIFIGALQSVPQDLYEAADIDGADGIRKFRYITLPWISPIIGINFMLTLTGAIEVFEIPFIMTRGANGSSTFVIETVDTAFKFRQYGVAAAMAVVLLLFVMTVIAVQGRIFRSERAI